MDAPSSMTIRTARSHEHPEILKIAKTSPYTGDFGNRVMFSSDAAYDKGWIKVILWGSTIVGFYCIRHKSRGERATKLYFITVHPDYRDRNVGHFLMEDLKREAGMHGGKIELDVAKKNRARAFYERHGFTTTHGDALGGEAWRMEWVKPA